MERCGATFSGYAAADMLKFPRLCGFLLMHFAIKMLTRLEKLVSTHFDQNDHHNLCRFVWESFYRENAQIRMTIMYIFKGISGMNLDFRAWYIGIIKGLEWVVPSQLLLQGNIDMQIYSFVFFGIKKSFATTLLPTLFSSYS